MNILFYPSWFQKNQKHNNGIFFKDQAEAISKNCKHNIVFLITDLQWQKHKIGFPLLSIHRRKEKYLDVWEYSVSLPTILNRVRIQERVTLELLRMAIIKMKGRYGSIDLIHAQSFIKAGYDACRLRQKYRIPVITTEHLSSVARGGVNPHNRQKLLYTISKSDKLICVSTFLDSMIEKTFPEQKKRMVIPNLVSPDFKYDEQINKNGIFTFISVGHTIPGKRLDILIEGFVKAFDSSEKVQLLIIGDGSQRKELEKKVEEDHRSHQIKFLGALSHSEVVKQMSKSHILVHTSQLETFGVVLIEALATGLPVICTQCGGPSDFLDNYGCTGIPVNDLDALVKAMVKTKTNYSNYDFKRISNDAINRFGDVVVAKQIDKVYKTVKKNNSEGRIDV